MIDIMTEHRQQVLEATEFAAWAHRNQSRKTSDVNFIIHPVHVSYLITDHGMITPVFGIKAHHTIMGALLHDTLEDNSKEVTYDLIRDRFGLQVANIVKSLTLDPDNPDKQKSRKRILTCSWSVRMIKIADIASNMMSRISAINQMGVKDAQQLFSQPFHETVHMELDFLKAARQFADPDPVNEICLTATEVTERFWDMVITARV